MGSNEPRGSRPRGRMNDVWILLISALSALTFMGAMVGLLAAFDGKPIFDSGAITLNTLVAILSTFSKAAIISAISFAISQAKWVVFASGRRRLLDFDRIDAASQGPLGSLHLLFNSQVRDIAVIRLCALLMVLAIALDPFAQQLLQYRTLTIFVDNSVVTPGTAIARAGRYSKGTEVRISIVSINFTEGTDTTLARPSIPPPIRADADFAMQSALAFGLSQPLSAVSQQVSFTCATGNCTYPRFSSLAVCRKCADVTSRLVASEVDPRRRLNITLDITAPGAQVDNRQIMRYELPNGLALDNSVEMAMLGTTNASQTLAHQDIDTFLWASTILRHPPGTNLTRIESNARSAVTATECALYLCVQSHTCSVGNGILTTSSTEIPSTVNPDSWKFLDDRDRRTSLSPSRQRSLAFHPRFSYPARSDLSLSASAGGETEAFNISQAAVSGISALLQRSLAACTRGSARTCNATLEPVADNWMPINGFYMTVRSGPQYAPDAAAVLFAARNVSDVFDAVAVALSNVLRSGADEGVLGGGAVRGELGILVTRYHVDWRWIGLHALVVGLAVTVVSWILLRSWLATGGVPVLGSSALAVLARGGEVGGLLVGSKSVEEMEGRARAAEVVMFGGDEVELMAREEWTRSR